ncbi:DUF3789 domain-containing protein [Enterococcus faecalis]|nr:DUF3789 domain-containing protein [Enterococcus faecalis]
MLNFILGLFLGALFGVVVMCIMSVSSENEQDSLREQDHEKKSQ